MTDIPCIDTTALFGPACAARDTLDAELSAAARGSGFLTITSEAIRAQTNPSVRSDLLRIFDLLPDEQRRLHRAKYNPENPYLYRGWNPDTVGESTSNMYDLGPDVAYPDREQHDDDPLLERTPFPPETAAPGWRSAAGDYYRAMEQIGAAIMRSFARSLRLEEHFFDDAFNGGISTLRFLRYEPVDPPDPEDPRFATPEAQAWLQSRGAHQDSGFVTLLVQDGVPGLQARGADGTWIPIPPTEGSIVVNFGGLLERWTGGRIKATVHRVERLGVRRHSIPFFFEAGVDTVIAPLPLPEGDRTEADEFAPFTYGDHLWSAMLKFPNFRGLEGRRVPRGTPNSATS